MLNVGLTGGIACGKTTVAKMFIRLGGIVIDFDKLAHEAQKPDSPAWRDIVNCFGQDVLCSDGKIDRIRLGSVVFGNPEKLQKLNSIVHPRVFDQWHLQLKNISAQTPHAIVFADVPLLFECAMQHLFDMTILVVIEPAEQIERLMARNLITRLEAQARLASQMPIHDKIAMADIVIDNRGAVEETQKRVQKVWQQLVEKEKLKTGNDHAASVLNREKNPDNNPRGPEE
ncbi:MAG TPA: dephospho-CoA kinase [Smithellaceae bacterium]|jgi:dephospho-CoA kinase|nr:dephospho-CoA kinase [Syntrophaceae bacterium]HPL97204.1 dephospho-CoA kinase [Smithellaceae bacterium]HPV50149.1 dephospho-CoA kinase [Smithellaceae bacterium]